MSGEASVDISAALKDLGDRRQAGIDAATKACETFVEVAVIGVAKDLCPVKTGALQASGTSLPAKVGGDQVEIEAGFNTSYAAAVHERLDLHHTQGQAKFLEAAIGQATPKLAPYVADAVKKAVESK